MEQIYCATLDRVQRRFVASRPNELWIADFTYVATWAGFAYVAFVIDAFARRIVDWRVSRSMQTDLAGCARTVIACSPVQLRLDSP